MRVLLAIGAATAIAAAGTTFVAAGSPNAHKPRAAKLSYYMQCFGLKTVGNDINTQASQGWTVTAMVDHTSPEGQECLLVLFQRESP